MPPFRSQFASKFLLKHHMAAIVLCTALSGVLVNRWLLDVGLERIVFRYPTAVLFSFLVFLLLMRVWLTYISRAFQQREAVSEFDDPDVANSEDAKSSKWDWDVSGLDALGADEPCGCLLLLFLVVVFGIFIFAFSLIAEAPLILAEAAFQFLLAAGLIRTARKIDNPNWIGSVLARTWKPFVVVFTATLLLGGYAEIACKNPTTVREMIRSCGGDTRR